MSNLYILNRLHQRLFKLAAARKLESVAGWGRSRSGDQHAGPVRLRLCRNERRQRVGKRATLDSGMSTGF
jgi:hypothetical protein